MEKSVADKDVWYPWIANDANLDGLRNEPRFIDLRAKLQGNDKPLSIADETIHPSQVPTKIFTAEDLEGTKVVEKEELTTVKPSFFYGHRYKIILAGVLASLLAIGMATGVITIDFEDRRFEIESKKNQRD